MQISISNSEEHSHTGFIFGFKLPFSTGQIVKQIRNLFFKYCSFLLSGYVSVSFCWWMRTPLFDSTIDYNVSLSEECNGHSLMLPKQPVCTWVHSPVLGNWYFSPALLDHPQCSKNTLSFADTALISPLPKAPTPSLFISNTITHMFENWLPYYLPFQCPFIPLKWKKFLWKPFPSS